MIQFTNVIYKTDLAFCEPGSIVSLIVTPGSLVVTRVKSDQPVVLELVQKLIEVLANLQKE